MHRLSQDCERNKVWNSNDTVKDTIKSGKKNSGSGAKQHEGCFTLLQQLSIAVKQTLYSWKYTHSRSSSWVLCPSHSEGERAHTVLTLTMCRTHLVGQCVGMWQKQYSLHVDFLWLELLFSSLPAPKLFCPVLLTARVGDLKLILANVQICNCGTTVLDSRKKSEQHSSIDKSYNYWWWWILQRYHKKITGFVHIAWNCLIIILSSNH